MCVVVGVGFCFGSSLPLLLALVSVGFVVVVVVIG
jgi:hypothetical protein